MITHSFCSLSPIFYPLYLSLSFFLSFLLPPFLSLSLSSLPSSSISIFSQLKGQPTRGGSLSSVKSASQTENGTMSHPWGMGWELKRAGERENYCSSLKVVLLKKIHEQEILESQKAKRLEQILEKKRLDEEKIQRIDLEIKLQREKEREEE